MQACPSCSTQLPDQAAFCSQCGARLAPRQSAPPATVLLQQTGNDRVHQLSVIRPGGGAGPSFPLLPGRSILGRGEVQIRLDDPYLSPRHADFTLRDGTLTVSDLQSSNGIFLRVRGEATLVSGNELRIGRQLLRFEPLPEPVFAADGGRIWGSPSRGAHHRVCQILEGSGLGEAIPVPDGEHLFGREEGGMIFPADPSVSRRHAILIVAGDSATVRDLDSANGTFMRLRVPAVLSNGDELLIGTQQLRYEVS